MRERDAGLHLALVKKIRGALKRREKFDLAISFLILSEHQKYKAGLPAALEERVGSPTGLCRW